eukprot:SAG31_NODE_18246_length_642_cov_1.136280_1_plen_24_part_10
MDEPNLQSIPHPRTFELQVISYIT